MQETEAKPELLWDLVEESLDEAEFLWQRWDLALSSHEHDLRGLAYWLEDRLLGSMDGVRVAGDAAVETLLRPALLGDEPGRAAAAAYILGSAGTPIALEALIAAFRNAGPDLRPTLRRGIELVVAPDLVAAIERRTADASADVHAAVLEASSFRHKDSSSRLLDVVTSESPMLQKAAVTAARHATRDIGAQCAAYGLRSYSDAIARTAAIETGLMFGLPVAWQACLDGAASGAPGSEPLLLLVALLGTPHAHERIFRALHKEECQKAALFALGFVGTTSAADACIDLMGKGLHVQLAADSLCAMTGLDLRNSRLLAPEPDEEVDVDHDASTEDLLPRPDVARVTAWWQSQRPHFHPNARYLGGIPVKLATLGKYLEHGVMRRRHGVALELAIRTGGALQVETRAFATEQRQQIAAFAPFTTRGIPLSPLASVFSPI